MMNNTAIVFVCLFVEIQNKFLYYDTKPRRRSFFKQLMSVSKKKNDGLTRNIRPKHPRYQQKIQCDTLHFLIELPIKNTVLLSTLRQRKRKKWSRLPKVRSLCSFLPRSSFSLSLSLLFLCCSFFVFYFVLFVFSCVCVCVSVSVCVSLSGPIFVSEFCFHFNHKFS